MSKSPHVLWLLTVSHITHCCIRVVIQEIQKQIPTDDFFYLHVTQFSQAIGL